MIEDSNVTGANLRLEGFSNPIVEAVKALSRREGESYDAFIDRAVSNPLTKPVKVADLLDNMDAVRLGKLPPKQAAKLAAKYEAALQRIRS